MKARMLVLSFVMTAAAVAAYVAPEPLLTPADGSPIPVAGGSGNVAIADLNRDTKPDLVVLSGMSRRVTILLGDGRGRFERPTNGLAVPESPNEIAMGDIDADGSVDLALASHDSHNVTLLLGDGRGGFRPSPRSPIVMRDGPRPHTHGLAVAEVNQDGRLDLATVNSDDNNDVSIALNDGQGRFTRTPGSPFAVAPSPYPMAQGDLDGDGDVDLVVSSTGLSLPAAAAAANRRLTMLLGDGRGSFERRDIPLRTSGSWFVATGDI
ncbi:MAG: FG-GAP repeat domain-containing protein, partial [Vicinamibacterales bacterium]